MAGAKEVRTKIQSVKSTQKITSAMQMVAASKMKRVQDRMDMSRPYAHMMRRVIRHMAESGMDVKHPYLEERPTKRIGYIIISTDRGLCGGLNINLFKEVVRLSSENEKNGIHSSLAIIGSKGIGFFNRFNFDITAQNSGMGDKPSLEEIIGTVKAMLLEYKQDHIDKLYLVFNKFVNTMTQQVKVQQILPLPKTDENTPKGKWDYIYEPEPNMLLDVLLNRYVESQVYQGVVENLACEQAARMMAMKSATENAEDLINDLQLVYNKARQASITQELTEIVSGAAAV